ncbi:TIGR02530 family flagellar biosynthesis protein [Tissierella creatinophila]|uniref:Flagellar operon protein n=1 Tax=Tissierella creatinophila DSM 6911 TaxID=1123403 RepID=A0A1U7M988_TISCR|nr:TIGR02530 family flagellar biosynthesis protein [Tissierella creatinophila]OLS03768.1 hypothetical protein TICRE_02810 [Tissierella creatinophila DSM 6911]
MSFRIQRGAIFPGQESIQNKPKADNGFENILKEKIGQKEELKLSSHAQKRLVERQIHLQKSDINKLTNAIDRLEEKGAKESLMIYKDMAFIASIKNRTIITAMGSTDLDIVTNIDSTIIVK